MGIEIETFCKNIDAKTKAGENINLYGYIDDYGISLSFSIGDLSVELNEEYLWLAFRGFLTGKFKTGVFSDYSGDYFTINENTIEITNNELSSSMNKHELTHNYWYSEDENKVESLIKLLISAGDDLYYSRKLKNDEFFIKFTEATKLRKVQDFNREKNKRIDSSDIGKYVRYSLLENFNRDYLLDNLLKDNINRLNHISREIEIQDIKVWKHELPLMLEYFLGITNYTIKDDYSIFGFVKQGDNMWFVEYPPGEDLIPIKEMTDENVCNFLKKFN